MPGRSMHDRAADTLVSTVFEIFAADALSGYRIFKRRITKHPIYTVWSVSLTLIIFGAIVRLIAYIVNTETDAIEFPMQLNDILFLFFMALMGKSMLDTYHTLIEREASVFLLVQPFNERRIVLGKMLTVTLFNLALLAFGLGLITALTFAHSQMYFVIPPYIVADMVVLTVLASSVGFTFAVLSGLSSWRRKIVGGILFSPLMSAIWLFLMQLRLDGWQLTGSLGIVYMASLMGMPISSQLLLESWNTMTSSRAVAHPLRRAAKGTIFSASVKKYFGPQVASVFEKEFRTLMRKREGAGNAITLIGFLVFAVYFYDQLDGYIELPGFAWELLPIVVVAISLYLAVVLLGLVPALGLISKDGKSTWIMKVAPVSEDQIITGKVLSLMVMLPFIIAVVAIPVPLLAGLSPISFLFSALGAIAMFVSGVGFGVWLGAKYPNFDEATGYAPDVMTMYTVMLVSLIFYIIVLIPPVILAFHDRFMGLMALIFVMDMCFLILVMGMRGASKSLRKLDVAF